MWEETENIQTTPTKPKEGQDRKEVKCVHSVITDGQRGTTVQCRAKSNETMWPKERGTNQRKEKITVN